MSSRLEELRAALAGHYEIERELGAGGMATVYLANDVKHQRQVAIKVLRPDLAAALGPDRFLREIRIAANLNHPHILGLFDSGEANGFLYYVMPYIEGQTLRDRIEKEGELPVNEAVRIIREVVDALAFAHSKGVVHRDIKPDNVMLTGGHAIVADFGVAKAVSEATGRDKLTTAGVALGTPAYMSPEQATADPHVDHRADIYAIGAVAYELLAGRTPFTGATPQSILAAHVTQQVDPVSRHRDQVSPQLEAVVMKCLAKKPADRWQSAGEMLPHLETMATTSGGVTPTATMPLTAVAGPKRHALPVMAGVAVVAVAGALILGRGDADTPASGPVDTRRPIAVLPFTTTGTDDESIAFTDGMHDDIRTQLSKISSLRVTARASVMGYSGDDPDIAAIGNQLGVQTVLSGGVQRAGSNVRINLELVDVNTTEVIWGDSYIRELTVENIFEIQRDIATSVARELSATLTAAELALIGTAPTDNEAAYEAYRRGQAFFRTVRVRSAEDMVLAARFYDQAVSLDPEFALAWAQLSQVHSLVYWFAYDPAPARIDRAGAAARRALELNPDLGEAHLAMGYYHYYANRDYDAALEEFALAERQIPGDAELLRAKGFVYRRQARWNDAISMFDLGLAIDPSDSLDYYYQVAEVYGAQRQYDRAIAAYERSVVGGHEDARWFRALTTIHAGRGVGALREIVDRMNAGAMGSGLVRLDLARYYLLLFTRDWGAMASRYGGDSVMVTQGFVVPYALVRARAAERLGLADAADHYSEAERRMRSVIAERPDDPAVALALAHALAGLGRAEEARAIASETAARMTFERDALIASFYQWEAAAVFARNGDDDLALDRLEYILSHDAVESRHTFELDPRFDSIRDHPRYREVLGLD